VNLEGALTWAFEFEDQPPFAGFRALASDGIDLPVLNLFRMFAKISVLVLKSLAFGFVRLYLRCVKMPGLSDFASKGIGRCQVPGFFVIVGDIHS